ncbi:MAG: DUF3786 domain-containing protein [Pseudomonadota bacterium]
MTSREGDREDQGGLFRWAEDLPAALWDDLAARPPAQAAEATEALWQDGRFRLMLVGEAFWVDPAGRRIWREAAPAERVSYQAGVVLLSALAKSQGVPPSGRMVTPPELPGGALFFTGAHAVATAPLARAFAAAPAAMLARAQALGSADADGADLAWRLPGLPKLPLYALLWRGDEEFGARAVIGIDDRAPFHLDLGGVFALTNLLVRRLIKD